MVWKRLMGALLGTVLLLIGLLTVPPLVLATASKSGTWLPLGPGLNGPVYAIAVSGTDVYAGGDFTDAGGNANADYIARWDGNCWQPLGSGLNAPVHAIAISGSSVYVGGQFKDAGGNTNADYLARWDTVRSKWEPLSTDSMQRLTNTVYAIAFGRYLYVGGSFQSVGGKDVNFIAKWVYVDGKGYQWMRVGDGLNAPVHAITIRESNVYAGGYFTDAGGNTNADYIARLDGNSWQPLGPGLNGMVSDICIGFGVYAGGYFTDAGGNANADYIARWDGNSWQSLGPGLNAPVHTIALRETGSFLCSPSQWFPSPQPTGGPVDPSQIPPPELKYCRFTKVFAGGYFTDAGGDTSADFIAVCSRWDITGDPPTFTWRALGTPISFGYAVYAIAVHTAIWLGPPIVLVDLYIGGDFHDYSPHRLSNVAQLGE